MITIKEAEKIIWENIPPATFKKINTEQSLGFVLSENIIAPISSPTYTNSAMDGFAVIWEDVQGASENNKVSLNIIGESQAGLPFKEIIKSGETIRINTGAMLPNGADSIIPIEHCHEIKSEIKIFKIKKKYRDVRFKGEEFENGSKIINEGTILDARQVALLASMGITNVNVFDKPKISIIVTGTELVDFKHETEDQQLRDTNTPMLCSLICESEAQIDKVKRVGDSLDETIQVLIEVSETSDLIIFSGGVSVGPHDHVKDAAKVAGFKELFWKIKQKPGKPLFFAKKGDNLLFGLPGNPVSAYMTFFHYIKPVLAKMSGGSVNRDQLKLVLGHDYFVKGDRTQFLRISIEENEIHILNRQGSHMLTSITDADGYIIADSSSKLEKGKLIDVFLFPERRK